VRVGSVGVNMVGVNVATARLVESGMSMAYIYVNTSSRPTVSPYLLGSTS
jgi:hypothetical protein